MSTTGPRTVRRALNILPHLTQDKTKMLSNKLSIKTEKREYNYLRNSIL